MNLETRWLGTAERASSMGLGELFVVEVSQEAFIGMRVQIAGAPTEFLLILAELGERTGDPIPRLLNWPIVRQLIGRKLTGGQFIVEPIGGCKTVEGLRFPFPESIHGSVAMVEGGDLRLSVIEGRDHWIFDLQRGVSGTLSPNEVAVWHAAWRLVWRVGENEMVLVEMQGKT